MLRILIVKEYRDLFCPTYLLLADQPFAEPEHITYCDKLRMGFFGRFVDWGL